MVKIPRGVPDFGRTKKRNLLKVPLLEKNMGSSSLAGLTFGFGLGEADGAFAIGPFAALFHELYAFEALHYRALTSCATFTFERVVLGHRIKEVG